MVNPDMAQPEEYLFNNSWQFLYSIKTDQRNPYLDVVFDGSNTKVCGGVGADV